ncbi:MAG: hypothetical protein EVA80_04660 [Proteobacteria bacterium]|nr:MAG: hypothetical protein EVA80_04660 [Pseudomonadota bacterium]
MTKNFILCLYVIIFNPLLVFGNNPFSTKLTSNQKKVELAEKKFDFDTAKSLGSVQTTSDVAPGNLNFRLVGIVSNNGECSILIQSQNSYEWVESGNSWKDWKFDSCEESLALFSNGDQLKRLSLGQASIEVKSSKTFAK